jgi:tRNA (cytidine/uridine-2'-O-)-methyltransferase
VPKTSEQLLQDLATEVPNPIHVGHTNPTHIDLYATAGPKTGYFFSPNPTQYLPEVVLCQPQIPQNTGTIARLAAAWQFRLHVVEPLGFAITDKAIKRAGLDYWDYVCLYQHKSMDMLLSAFPNALWIFIDINAPLSYANASAENFFTVDPCVFTGQKCVLVFGAETFGIQPSVWEACKNLQNYKVFYIPMFHDKVRSINLANTVSIVVSQFLRKF